MVNFWRSELMTLDKEPYHDYKPFNLKEVRKDNIFHALDNQVTFL